MLSMNSNEAILVALVVIAPVLLTVFVVLVAVTTLRRRRADSTGTEVPTRSVELRLAEAEDLRRRGLITADELGESRQRILREL